MLGNLTESEIEVILHEQAVGRIGYVADGQPYVVPVSYAYDGHRIICHSSIGHKIHAMRVNPAVCFETEQVTNLVNWKSVVADGRFEELGGATAAAAMGLLVEKLVPLILSTTSSHHGIQNVTPHGESKVGGNTVVFCICLGQRRGRFERSE